MTKKPSIKIRNRVIGLDYPPLVITEIGINHEGSMAKAKRMIRDAKKSGAECIKLQSHVVEDEMTPAAKRVIPINANESIWDIMKRCAFSESQERQLKQYAESLGLLFLSTPFSRAAADRLQRIGVDAYKIGSGECNNYPLVQHIASFKKPIILSTGMNNISSITPSVKILRKNKIPFALMHCVSMYPTPYNKVQLGAIQTLQHHFPDAVVGLSDHSVGIYTCLAGVALGCSILEKHFTSSMKWTGPDIAISIDPIELHQLIMGSKAIFQALGGSKRILHEEQPTINFAYACVVSIRDIKKGELFSKDNLWVKRPGTGEIKAKYFSEIIGRKANQFIPTDTQLTWANIKK